MYDPHSDGNLRNVGYKQLMADQEWLAAMQVDGRSPTIDLLTGETPSKQRFEKVKRFAPKANCPNEEELQLYRNQEIDTLICTERWMLIVFPSHPFH